MLDITKHKLPNWVRWIAQDADGTWWGYECEPLQHDSGWYENEVGRNIRITITPSIENWQSTARKLAD